MKYLKMFVSLMLVLTSLVTPGFSYTMIQTADKQTIVYDNLNTMQSVIDKSGNRTEYNSNSQRSVAKNSAGVITNEWNYDSLGRMESMHAKGVNGSADTMTYYVGGDQAKSITVNAELVGGEGADKADAKAFTAADQAAALEAYKGIAAGGTGGILGAQINVDTGKKDSAGGIIYGAEGFASRVSGLTLTGQQFNALSTDQRKAILGWRGEGKADEGGTLGDINGAVTGTGSSSLISIQLGGGSTLNGHGTTAAINKVMATNVTVQKSGITAESVSPTKSYSVGVPDPVVQGILKNVIFDDKTGKYYAVISANKIDMLDGKGPQDAGDAEIYVEISQEQSKSLKVGEDILVDGNLTKDYQGNLTMTSTFIKTGAEAKSLDTWIKNNAGTYQALKDSMAQTWADVKAQHGDYSSWQQGAQFMKQLFGL